MKEEQININELISVEQLPKVFYQLETIGSFIKEQLKDIDKMICSEENKQEVKKRKQEITSTKNLLEEKRKEVKKKILEPYDLFNDKYEEEVKKQLENAEKLLNDKINKIESEQKQNKENDLRKFFENHQKDLHIENFSNFDDIGLNITLSASMKSLETKILEYCDKIDKDLKLIELEEYKDEILVEYQKVKEYSVAKINVIERHNELEKISKINEIRQEEIKQEEIIENKVEEILAPIEINEELITISFTINDTIDNIKKVKQFLIENGIKWK